MKKFFVLVMAASCLFISCNPKDEKEKDGEEETTKKKDKDADDEERNEDESDNSAKIATGVCNCMNSAVEGFSAQGKRIIIKAGNSSNPTQTLQTELMNIEDEEEKQKLGREFQSLAAMEEDTDMKDCMEKLKKKYDFDENDRKAQQKVARALEDKEGCEVVTALMKIGMKEQKGNTTDD